MEITRTTIVFHTHTTTICAYMPVNLSLSLSLSLIRASVILYTLQSHLRAILFSLRAYRRVYLSRYIERRYACTDYPQNVSHYDYVTLRSRCSVRHVRSRGRGSYVIGKKGTSLSRYSYFLYARSGTAALPIHYRGLNIFTARNFAKRVITIFFVTRLRERILKPRASRTLQELLSCRFFERRIARSFFFSFLRQISHVSFFFFNSKIACFVV